MNCLLRAPSAPRFTPKAIRIKNSHPSHGGSGWIRTTVSGVARYGSGYGGYYWPGYRRQQYARLFLSRSAALFGLESRDGRARARVPRSTLGRAHEEESEPLHQTNGVCLQLHTYVMWITRCFEPIELPS